MKTINYILIFLFCIICLSSCSSKEEKKIELIDKQLQASRFWETSYNFDLCDFSLICKESTFFKDGQYVSRQGFYHPNKDTLLFVVSIKGTYNIEYNKEYKAFFLNQEMVGNPHIENYNTLPEYYKAFETELLVNYHGDAYDQVEDEDDSTIYAQEIIECTTKHLIIKDLTDNEVYRYEPTNEDSFPGTIKAYDRKGRRIL